MAVVTTAGTPLGTGLIRYSALGGEPIRDAAHYAGLNAPTSAYVVGETVEVLLDAGYSQVSAKTTAHLLGAYRVPNAPSVQTDQGDNKTYHLQLQFITDQTTNSDLAAFEALQDAGMQGSVLFWYPDFINYPTEYIPCVIRTRHNPARNGVFFTVDLELSAISTTVIEPVAFAINYALDVKATGVSPNAYVPATSTVKLYVGGWFQFTPAVYPSSLMLFGLSGCFSCLVTTDVTGATQLSVTRPTGAKMYTDSYIIPSPMAHIAVMMDPSLPTEAERLLILFNGQPLPWSAGGATTNNTLPAATLLYLPDYNNASESLVNSIAFIEGVTPDYAAIGSSPSHNITAGQYPGLTHAWNFQQSLSPDVGSAVVNALNPVYVRVAP